MTLLFYPVLSLILLVLQTTLLPDVALFNHCFDLLIINVLYLSLFTSNLFVVFYVMGLGWIMDSISGAPFGFYVSSYVWIYALVQILRHVVHAGNFIFIPLMSVAAVCMEHGFLMFILLVRQDGWFFSSMDFIAMLEQALVGGFVIPIALGLIHSLRMGWYKKVRSITGKKMGIRG